MLHNEKHQEIVTENTLASVDKNIGAIARTPSVPSTPAAHDRYVLDFATQNHTRTYMGGYGTGDFSNLWWQQATPSSTSAYMIDQRQEITDITHINAAKIRARWIYS